MTLSPTPLRTERTPATDASAAHELLCELRTRIATQALPRQYGVEASALQSLWEIFAQARDAMKKNPGCETFAAATTTFLNVQLRPFTGKWHRAHVEGQLATRDGADQFRGELAAVQAQIGKFADLLHEMAYGKPRRDEAAGPVLTPGQLHELMAPLTFGIPTGWCEASADTPAPDSAVTGEAGSAAPMNFPEGSSESTAAKMNRLEKMAIDERRKNTGGSQQGLNAVGLALSGGGIRSATFCLGVVQVLAKRGILQDVDFLSTVSGGGYIGTFISQALGTKGSSIVDLAGPDGPDPELIRRLRAQAKFLRAENVWERCSRITAVVAGMLLNWMPLLLLLILAAIVAAERPKFWPSWLALDCVVRLLTISSAVGLVGYGLTLSWKRWAGARTGVLAVILGTTTICAAMWCLRRLGMGGEIAHPRLAWSVSVLAGAMTSVPTILRFATIAKTPLIRRIALRVALVIGALVVPVLAALAFKAFLQVARMNLDENAPLINPVRYLDGVWILVIGAGLAFLVTAFLDVNLTGPHRIYRDALARTFIDSVNQSAQEFPLLKALDRQGRAPYHLLNATVNLPSSRSPTLRDRRGDFFVFSKHYCGSVSTGYLPTEDWRFGRKEADVATAMAVSGAAVAPLMGLDSIGLLSSLITFLNVRLGFWVRNPRWKLTGRWPGFGCLLREMTGLGMSEQLPWLYLTDGGHIENTGCYELLRRRCKFIICVDGEADPEVSFGGLLTLVRHVQIDFGIQIEPWLDDLRRAPGMTTSAGHGAFCVVHYPAMGKEPPAKGLLLYLKLSMTGNESALIQRYAKSHPEFPYQTTLDQFFDQEQFEAYRQLGVHVADGFFGSALLGASTEPKSVAGWFRGLAESLLEPDWLRLPHAASPVATAK